MGQLKASAVAVQILKYAFWVKVHFTRFSEAAREPTLPRSRVLPVPFVLNISCWDTITSWGGPEGSKPLPYTGLKTYVYQAVYHRPI